MACNSYSRTHIILILPKKAQISMTDPKAPVITFPCDYPIKVIGDMAPDFKDFVTRVARNHDPRLKEHSISVNTSRNGRFLSVRLVVWLAVCLSGCVSVWLTGWLDMCDVVRSYNDMDI